ncbi:MAG: tail fiber domain-containing protein [Spirosomataceae bacterium]|jgi:hypothetical protein
MIFSKKSIFTTTFLIVSLWASAQSTEIRPGIVLPQVTTAQRTGIASPINGMLVFDSNTQSYWFRQSGTWVELNGGGAGTSYWQLNGLGGNEIKNTNIGGVWSANPTGLDNSSNDVSNPPTAPVNGAGTRMMWIPSRSAFRVGTILGSEWDADSIGLASFAAGYSAKATGRQAVALGSFTDARGRYSTSMGYSTDAFGPYSTAMGSFTKALGMWSTATGQATEASGDRSTAMGNRTKASGDFSMATGDSTTASGNSSTAMGHQAFAFGNYSTAIGHEALALANYATAIGRNNIASDSSATAMGGFTKAYGKYSTALGKKTFADGDYSVAMGNSTTASGDNSTAMGGSTTASNTFSTAMGFETTASGNSATTMGNGTTASGNYSTAIGRNTTAGGISSIAMGTNVTANGNGTVIIGDGNPGGTVYTSGTINKFIGRFYNGYYLLTNATGAPATGVNISHGQTAWSAISDSTRKENFIPANGDAFLEKLRGLRLGSWNYKTDEENPERFYGPMAQEIFAAYGKDAKGTIGSDTLVSTLNMDGLLFIFAQELEKRTSELKEENKNLRKQLAAKDEKYLQLFAEVKAEITKMKLTVNSKELSTGAED